MKRRDLIAGTGIALSAIALQGLRNSAKATTSSASQTTHPRLPGWLRSVNLTAEQKSAIRQIDHKFAANLATQKRSVKGAAVQLRQLKQSHRASDSVLQTQQKLQDRTLQSYQATLSAKYYAYGEVLTAQQRRQVRRVLAKRRNRNSYVAAIMV